MVVGGNIKGQLSSSLPLHAHTGMGSSEVESNLHCTCHCIDSPIPPHGTAKSSPQVQMVSQLMRLKVGRNAAQVFQRAHMANVLLTWRGAIQKAVGSLSSAGLKMQIFYTYVSLD